MENNWIRADKDIKDYPIGTKFKALMGGHWTRTFYGFKWCTGSTFPSVGGDWTGDVCIPSLREEIILYMLDEFRKKVKNYDANLYKDKPLSERYYPKWTFTYLLSTKMDIPSRTLRCELNKMEKDGIVHSKRSPNNIDWALNKIEGFKQHKYTDYYCLDI